MSQPIPLSLRTALEDAVRRLEGFLDTDCECDSQTAPCALCQAREALQQDADTHLGTYVLVEDKVSSRAWCNTYAMRAFETPEAAIEECREDCIQGHGYEDDPSQDSRNITTAFVAQGNIIVDDVSEWRGTPNYML